MNSVNILVEAKNEYTSQLQKILTPRLYEGFKSIYEDIIKILSNELIENKSQGSSIIKTFQKSLKDIPQWNQDIINKEFQRILQMSNCDYFENLVEAIFITNTKILTSVQINDDKSQNIKINIPQATHFIHKCYIECSKEIYKNPYIFDISKGLTPKEKHANLRDSLILIDNAINSAIRDLLPIRDILSQGLTKLTNNINTKEIEVNEEEEMEEEDNDEKDTEEEEDAEDEDAEDDDESELSIENNEMKIEENKPEINDIVIEENKIPEIEINETPKIIELDNSIIDKEILEIHNEVLDNLENTEPAVVETKEIFLGKSVPNTFKKISSVEKINENVVDIEDSISNPPPPRLLIPSKLPQSKNIVNNVTTKKVDISMDNNNNPFIKNIRNKKFMKNKFLGIDKNNSFYKKKYEENSANFHSISEGIKEQNSIVSEVVSTNNIIKPQLTSESILSKVTKNQINLDADSSVEDEEENIEL